MKNVRDKSRLTGIAIAVFAGISISPKLYAQNQPEWKVHDLQRPQPKVISPGTGSTTEKAGAPPSDAIVLFDGRNLSEWRTPKNDAPKWKVENGYFEVVDKTGPILTKQTFGDCQLHIEWATPTAIKGKGQGRGNSGVFFMKKYEIQVLDCYENQTYPDGQAGSVYGQFPPLVNASRPPGEWQTYDIIFRRPRFDAAGVLIKPAIVTVFHNGVLVQDHVAMTGPTGHKSRPPYAYHADKLPLMLQDHGNPVRFRNIWIRSLE